MSKRDLEQLSRDILESDLAFVSQRERAFLEIVEVRSRASHLRVFKTSCYALAVCAAIAMVCIFMADKRSGKVRIEHTSDIIKTVRLEIASTAQIAPHYQNIDGPDLHQLFPKGILIAEGETPNVIAF